MSLQDVGSHDLPGGSPMALMQMVQAAQATFQDIKVNSKHSKKKKRGPARNKLRLTYYLLPENAPPPQTTSAKDAPLRETHHQCGFGMLTISIYW